MWQLTKSFMLLNTMLFEEVSPAGVEPATFALKGQRLNQFVYGDIFYCKSVLSCGYNTILSTLHLWTVAARLFYWSDNPVLHQEAYRGIKNHNNILLHFMAILTGFEPAISPQVNSHQSLSALNFFKSNINYRIIYFSKMSKNQLFLNKKRPSFFEVGPFFISY